jgi:propionyl-CoA synthetase
MARLQPKCHLSQADSTAMSRAAAPTRRRSSTTARSPARSAPSPIAELTDEVATFAAVLQGLGVGKGDRVIVYMPMVPEAAIAMLACARIGAIHSVVFGGFAAAELATRIDDAKPKVIVSASCGIEGPRRPLQAAARQGDRAVHGTSPRRCIVLQRPQAAAALCAGRDHDWAGLVEKARAEGRSPCVPVAATDPLYILYTSGTTGQPKGVVRDNGGHMVALNWSMANSTASKPGEVFWAASDVGWVVGHSYIVYAPLLAGARRCSTRASRSARRTPAPSGASSPSTRWRRCSPRRPPSARSRRRTPGRAYRKRYDLSTFRTLFLAGERADPDTIKWAEDQLKVPVIDHWWQTETGWCDRRQSRRPRAAAGEARLADGADAGLRRAQVARRARTCRRARPSARSW